MASLRVAPAAKAGSLFRDLKVEVIGYQLRFRDARGADVARTTLSEEEQYALRAQLPVPPLPRPDPDPVPRPDPGRTVVWRADLAEGTLRPDWTWSGFDQGQSSTYPVSRVILPGDDGVPPRPEFGRTPERVARFAVSAADVAAGRHHAKVYRDFPIAEMHGVYETWLYVPASFRSVAPANVFQFKEAKGGGASDPTWWIDLMPSQWCRSTGTWQGAKPAVDFRPVFVPRWFTQGKWDRPSTPFRAATPGWHHLVCDFTPQRIRYLIDDVLLFEGTAADYPLTYRGAAHHTFGVGNYGKNPDTVLYFGLTQMSR